ncbi:hypothetical protein TWF173_007015 [Orbilia oligospora]|nr:hypothetical protein TWF173_007015 [Orbilia oligospora]
MDLPPAVSASSSSAAHFLQLSASTAVGHNSSSSSSTSSSAGLGGQTGPRTQPAVRSSTSALGSAPPSLQAPITSSEKCAHKDVTRCSLHRGECCSCGDNRPHEQYYERYVDGSLVLDAPRWAHYCSACRDYWDRLNASVPSYRDNQPRLTAWDLFHDFGHSNPPPNPAAVASASHPNFAHSNSTSRHSLTSPAVPVITPEDGFPQSYAVFQHMSPNFSNEYHPVVAQHIRTWGELETRIADEPRYSPGFQSLLRQYYTARYKAKRMTELDRQSRGGSLSVQARDEYFQLLNTPGPFDMPISSGSGSGSSGNGRNESSSSSGAGTSRNQGNNMSHQPPSSTSTSTAAGEHRSTLGTGIFTGVAARSTSATSQVSPPRSSHRRRGSTPVDSMPTTRINSQPENASRPAPAIDRERERDRDRETGRITAADRRRQLRERNESEWENQRPLSISSPGGSNTNRTSVDSTVVDAVMSDLPSSQNSDTSNRSSNSASEPGRASENEPSVHNPLRHRPYFNIPPTSEPWNTSLLPGESSRNQLNDPSVTTPYRRDGSSNPSASTPQNTMSGSPITSIAPFVFPANRRTLRPTLLDQTTSSPTQSPPESSMARNGLTSPANRLPPNFLPSLPHLPAPRFSPPRTLTRPRGGSISNNSNNNTNTNHNRQNSNGSDGFPARRRERINPSAQPLGGRTDAEREDYESPTRSVFTELVETNRQAEITRRRFRELEAEQRELLRSPPMPGSDGDSMRRLQEHRQQRNYELLQRANLQRQMQQNQVDLPGGSRPQPVGPQGWYANWPGASQSASNGNNAHARSPDHASALSFTVVAEDEPSSASEADYEDLIPLDNALNDDEQLFATLVGGYLSGVPHESVNRRRARLRGQLGLSPDDVGHLPGSQPSNRAPENDMRERFPSRADRARRMRDRDIETRYRHNEAIRDIANLVTGARESGVMGFPHRWSRESGSGSNSNGRNTNNNSSQTTRTLDNPERPDNMKEEDLKIMVDCKVCYGQIADMVLLPCAHLVLCQWCADTVAPAAPNRPEGMVAPRSNCPVCRARVERKIKVFRC